MIILASFVWIVLCIVAVLLSVLAHQASHFFLTDGLLSKPFLLWIASMIVLDIGVILIALIIGYSPPSIACVMFLLIQGMYALSSVGFYVKSKVEDNINIKSVKKQLRFVPSQAIFLTTMVLTVSFGVQPGIMLFVPAFAIAGLMWLLDHFFTSLIADRAG